MSIRFKMNAHYICFGGHLALICWLMLASIVVQLEAKTQEWPVKVERSGEIDGCNVMSSELPMGDIKPLSYYLLLEVDLDAPKFAGIVEASLKINNETSRIVLNADESLDLQEVWYHDYGRISAQGKDKEQLIKVKDACLNEQLQILVINLEQTVVAETVGKLNFVYLGKYSDKMDGLFKMSYEDKSGKSHRVVLSELEPRPEISMARKLFPCFDDPQYEAFISLNVARKSDVEVRSNSEPESDTEMQDGTGRKLIRFTRTDPIAPQQLYLTLSN